MEWLLILSAMLSAVTGAFTGAHGDEAQVHQAGSAVAVEAAVAAVEAVAPAAAAPPAVNVQPAGILPLPTFGFAARLPLETVRLLE